MNAEARGPLLNALDEAVTRQQKATEMRLAAMSRLESLLLGVMLVALVLECWLIYAPMVKRVTESSRRLLQMSQTDPLTGLSNRRAFAQQARTELARLRRLDQPLSLISVDIDHFKEINDRFGHAGGDVVLKVVATTLKEAVRPTDVVARMGGEEFVMLLSNTDHAGAMVLAERLRSRVEAASVGFGSTASFGVAAVDGHLLEIETALAIADRRLYRAKGAGRNYVVGDDGALSQAAERERLVSA